MPVTPASPENSASMQSPGKGAFPIVAIGASAGGLQAIRTFLAHVPEGSGMAFVVVLHMDPDHRSLLEELLQHDTTMPVSEVRGATEIQAEHVYVIPPDWDLSVQLGVLHLVKPTQAHGQRLPIDFFFHRLAEDCPHRAVGVILSGTGSDGTAGLRAIKQESGLTVVEDPDAASYVGMPVSAIEAGLADVVGPPEELPHLIMEALRQPDRLEPIEHVETDMNAASLAQVLALLQEQTGHDFSLYKKNTLYRRIGRRMGLYQIADIADYPDFLRNNPTEADILLKELLISVTRFFRDPDVWEKLRSEVMPALLAAHPDGAILRAWVPGCATGEEAYSLAMIFLETLESIGSAATFSLQIFATDLDHHAIAKARLGWYPMSIAADVSAARLERFFASEQNGYRVSQEIREMVIFAPHNLLADPPFSKLDFLSCRNLLIYLAPGLHETLLRRFHYSMNPDAILVLGSSESVGTATNLFVPLAAQLQLYRRLNVQIPEKRFEFPSRSILFPPASAINRTSHTMTFTTANKLEALSDQFLLRRYAPTAVLINDVGDILHVSGKTGKYLEVAEGKANWNILAMVREGLSAALNEAFQDAVRLQEEISLIGEKTDGENEKQRVEITVHPITEPAALHGMLMVVFADVETAVPVAEPDGDMRTARQSARLKTLMQALQNAREALQASREEMQTSREELTSTNEELQSTNEELTTSTEELRTMNEELARARAAAEQSLARYADLFDAAPVGYFTLDRRGAITRTNLVGASLLGSESGSLVGGRFNLFVTEADRAVFMACLEKTFSSKEAQVCEVGLWRDATEPCEVSISALALADGKTCRVVVSDVTQRKQAEMLKNQLASIVESAHDAIISNTPDGIVLTWNPGAEQLFGYSAGEMIGQSIARLIPPDCPHDESVIVERLGRGENIEHHESVRLRKDGTKVDVALTISPIRDSKGRVIGASKIIRDITERHRAEAALVELKNRYEATVNASGQLLYDWNPATHEVNYGGDVKNIIGYDIAELTGGGLAHWRELIHTEDRDIFSAEIERVIASKTPFHLEYRVRRKDGIFLNMVDDGHFVLDAQGNITRMVGFVADITARKRDEAALRDSEERYRRIVETAEEGIWSIDAEANTTFVNPKMAQMLGYTVEEMEGLPLTYFMDEQGRSIAEQNLARRRQGTAERHEFTFTCKDGSELWTSISANPIQDANGRYAGALAMVTDITERRKADESLRQAAMVYQHSTEAMMITDSENRIVAINPAFTKTTGYEAHEVLGKDPRLLSSGRHDRQFHADIWEALAKTGTWQGEIWNRRKNGEAFAEMLTINTIYLNDGAVHRHVALFSDITQKKESEEIIWHQANFDSLTQLPNRSMFHDRLAQEIRKDKREKAKVALLFIDLDRFKEVNDTLGHHVGDLLLIEAASRIADSVRESDTVARLGGDEFTVILAAIEDVGSIDRVAESILKKLAAPFFLGPERVFVSASIGITLYPDDSGDIGDLLKYADQALYVAKNLGRNRYSYFTAALQDAAEARMRLINDLRGALDGQQFRVYYQPIVELATGSIHKAEALIRWQHPTRGLVNPADFIPMAEHTGMILEIGDWVFRQASLQARHWRATHDAKFQISVNKSPVQFRDATLAGEGSWLMHLEELGLTGDSIAIEITEGLLLDTTPAVTKKLLDFRDAGVQVALDDFGTGYSSLSYLKKFDIDYLKIDQSFVCNLETDFDDRTLCEAIIVMAHKLGLKVIAEGVETEAQRRLLTEAGCDYAQGFLFSKPVPAGEMMLKCDAALLG